MNKKLIVLLCGPALQSKNAAYGGGVGGYTRNMFVYLKYFKSEKFLLEPCFQTVRNNRTPIIIQFPLRLIKDTVSLLYKLVKEKPFIVHIMGQYRSATPKEFMAVFISRLFRKKVIYEIKAGKFINYYYSTNVASKFMLRYMLKKSTIILVEGGIYLEFVNKLIKANRSYLFPNFVPVEQVPKTSSPKLRSEKLKVLFVGFCYDGKGVFDLINGLNRAAVRGQNIELTLIGEEETKFKNWLDSFSLNKNFIINRRGKQPHEIVLEEMAAHDIYFYPSKHSGEGHNNSINEAMMNNMVIVTTKIGFLPSVLMENAYFLEEVSDTAIADIVNHISQNKDEAVGKALNAKARLIDEYTSDKQIPMLESYYNLVLKS